MEKCFFTGPLYERLEKQIESNKTKPLEVSKIDFSKIKIVEPKKEKEIQTINLIK